MNRHAAIGISAVLFTLVGAVAPPAPASAGTAVLNIVLVLDGLRPDSITAPDTPNLWRLREEGVNFLNGHSVFPTVTRANATAIGTGTYPDRNGIFGNSLYVRAVDPNHSFGNDDHQRLAPPRCGNRWTDDPDENAWRNLGGARQRNWQSRLAQERLERHCWRMCTSSEWSGRVDQWILGARETRCIS